MTKFSGTAFAYLKKSEINFEKINQSYLLREGSEIWLNLDKMILNAEEGLEEVFFASLSFLSEEISISLDNGFKAILKNDKTIKFPFQNLEISTWEKMDKVPKNNSILKVLTSKGIIANCSYNDGIWGKNDLGFLEEKKEKLIRWKY